MIEIQHVSKRYGNIYAVQDANFTIKKGEILGFLGRNGAGKTTTMNIITGYISASEGRVLVDGYDILENSREVKRRIGYLPEQPPLYVDMTVEEYLRFVSSIKELNSSKITSHLNDVCDLVGIADMRKRLIKNLSKGYKQRVGLAQALIGNPEVVILDEPTVGLDPKQIIEIRKLIKALGENHTVVLSSHILHEVSDVCERVVIINQGKIVAEDTLDNLARGAGDTFRMMLRVLTDENTLLQSTNYEREIQKMLRDLEGVRYVEAVGVKEPGSLDFLIESSREQDVRAALFRALAKREYPILMLKPMDIELEDIFLQLTGDRGGEH